MPNTTDKLYHAVYDLLGVKRSDRAMPSSSRPHSAIYSSAVPRADYSSSLKLAEDAELEPPPKLGSITRLRSGSLPTLIPAHRDEVDQVSPK